MERIKKIIENNKGKEFVVHVKSKNEFETLLNILEELSFEYTIPLTTLREMATNFVSEDGYDGCWRISEQRGIAYNQSVEHWRQYYSDIIEIENGEIIFIE